MNFEICKKCKTPRYVDYSKLCRKCSNQYSLNFYGINPIDFKTNEVYKMSEENKKPVQKFRVGNVSASVWENKKEEIKMYNVTFEKSYKDKEGNWQNSNSFNINELPKLKLCLSKAYAWIFEHED